MDNKKIGIYIFYTALLLSLCIGSACLSSEQETQRRQERKEDSRDDERSHDTDRHERDSERRQEHRRYLQRRLEDYLQWLKDNYPDEAARLERLKEEKPDDYGRHVGWSMRRYAPIMEASEEDLELADILKKELELKRDRDRLIRKINETKDEEKKKEFTEDLKAIVSERFDLIIQRKQLFYKRMLEELEELKQRIHENKAELEEFINEKETNVEDRVESLLRRERRFDWGS